MKRRKFLVASVVGGFSTLGSRQFQRQAVSVDLRLSDSILDIDPTTVNSVIIDFDKIDITTQYLDSTEDLSITVQATLNSNFTAKKTSNVSFTNERKVQLSDISSDSTDISSLVIDGFDTDDSYVLGEVKLEVNHPDIQPQSYTRKFSLTESGVKVITGFENGNVFDNWVKVGGNSNDKITFSSNRSKVGSNSLLLQNRGSGDTPKVKSYPGDGLGIYPNRNSTFDFWMYSGDNYGNTGRSILKLDQDGTPASLAFNQDSYDDKWKFRLYDSNGGSLLSKNIDGARSHNRQWVRVVFDMQYKNNFLEFRVYDESDSLLVSESYNGTWDTDNSDFGFRMISQGRGDTNNKTFYDNFKIY
jgi:hypothetical protein